MTHSNPLNHIVLCTFLQSCSCQHFPSY